MEKKKQRIDRVCLLILCDPNRCLPASLSLDVEGVRFFISVHEEDDVRSLGKIQSQDSNSRETGMPENTEASDAESDRRISGEFLGYFDFCLKFHIKNQGDDFSGNMITYPVMEHKRKEEEGVVTAETKTPNFHEMMEEG